MKKVSLFFCLAIIFSSVGTSSVSLADTFSKEEQSVSNEFSNNEIKNLERGFQTLEIQKEQKSNMGATINAGGTAAVKASIKFLLKNENKLFKYVEDYGGISARRTLEKYFGNVTPVLNKLLTWQSVAYGNIEGLISSSLIQAGVSSGTARTIGWLVREAAEWLV